MEQKRNKWFLLQPEQKEEIRQKDKLVIAAMLVIFAVSILIEQVLDNEDLAFCGIAVVAAIGTVDAFYEVKQPHTKRAARQYMVTGIGCALLFFALIFTLTRRVLGI